MRRRLAAATIGLALILGLAPSTPVSLAQGTPQALAPGDDAPRLKARIFPGNVQREVDWTQNELTLVNFWAAWCKPCREEMPKLQILHNELRDDGFEVIGPIFDVEFSHEAVADYLESYKISYPILKTHIHFNRLWGGITILPTSFLVSGEGKVLRRYIGAMPEQTKGLMADVRAVIAGRPMDPQVIPGPPGEAPLFDE